MEHGEEWKKEDRREKDNPALEGLRFWSGMGGYPADPSRVVHYLQTCDEWERRDA